MTEPEPVMVSPQDGVWATYAWDVAPYLIGVHLTEVEALRAAVAFSGRVVFLPWGTALSEVAE